MLRVVTSNGVGKFTAVMEKCIENRHNVGLDIVRTPQYGSYRGNLIAEIKSHKVRSGIAAQTQNL